MSVDHELERRLSAALDVVPIPELDLQRMNRSMRRGVRRRRLRQVGVAGGLTLALAVIPVSMQIGAVPYPDSLPAVSLADRPSQLSRAATKGSLADDEAWLSAFRTWLGTQRWDESGGESWRVAGADAVDVIYAGDIGDERMVLAEVAVRWGLIEARTQKWFHGQAGAEPQALIEASSGEPQDLVVEQLGLLIDGQSTPTQGFLIVSSQPEEVTLLSPTYDRDGSSSVSRTPVQPSEPGVYEAVSPNQATDLAVNVAGRPEQPRSGISVDAALIETWLEAGSIDQSDPALGTQLGPLSPDFAVETWATHFGLNPRSLAKGEITLLADDTGRARAAVVRATRADGLQFVSYLGELTEELDRPGEVRTDLDGARRIVAAPGNSSDAENPESIGHAWTVPGRSGAPDVAVLGPAAAESVVFLDRDGQQVGSAAVTAGRGVVALPTDATTVAFSTGQAGGGTGSGVAIVRTSDQGTWLSWVDMAGGDSTR